MTYRKTWFSYVLWVVYTMLCAIFLVFVGNYVCESYLPAGLGRLGVSVSLPDGAARISGFLMLPVTALVYWTLRGISGRIGKKRAGKEINPRIPEIIAVCAVLALGIFLRVMRASEYIQLQESAGSGTQAYVNGIDYYNMAMVTEEGMAKPPVYGAACLYVVCLSWVLSFLGNRVASAVLFQVFLQAAGLVLSYTVARKTAGRIPACIALLYLACSPGFLEMLKNLGPECFFFVLYMIGMLAAAGFVKGYCENRFRKAQAVAGAAGVGILAGILGYLDPAAFTILPVMAAAAMGEKRRPEGMPANNTSAVSGAVTVMALFSCAAGFLGMAGAFSCDRGIAYGVEIGNWADLHIGNTRTSGFMPLYPYSLDMPQFGILAALAAFLVFEFFRGHSRQNYMLWILLCIIAAPTPMAVLGVQPFGIISMYIWGVLAGLGLQNCLFKGRVGCMRATAGETGQAAEAAAPQEEAGIRQTEEITETEKEVQKAKEITETKPRYLENPLPLPKKHTRRQMDYQYSVEEKNMKFDVEVKDNDDFDI